MSQLPNLFGVAGGGHNFFDRAIRLVGQFGDVHLLVLAIGATAILLLLLGERFLPGRPVGLTVVAVAILMATLFGLPSLGIPVTGKIRKGCRLSGCPRSDAEFEELFPIAAGCLLLAYIEGVSAARSFAAKHGYSLDVRQEFLGLGAANLAVAFGHGYPVAGGLSQSAVNDAAGARTPLALVVCSLALALCLLFFTGLLTNLPKRYWQALSSPPFTSWLTPMRCFACGGSAGSILCGGHRACVRAAAWNPARRPACCPCVHFPAAWPRVAAQHRVFSGGFPEPAAIRQRQHEGVEPLAGVIASGLRPRCFTSTPRQFWRRFWPRCENRLTSGWLLRSLGIPLHRFGRGADVARSP